MNNNYQECIEKLRNTQILTEEECIILADFALYNTCVASQEIGDSLKGISNKLKINGGM